MSQFKQVDKYDGECMPFKFINVTGMKLNEMQEEIRHHEIEREIVLELTGGQYSEFDFDSLRRQYVSLADFEYVDATVVVIDGAPEFRIGVVDRMWPYVEKKLKESRDRYGYHYRYNNVPRHFAAIGIQDARLYSYYGDWTTEILHETNHDAIKAELEFRFPDMELEVREGELWVQWCDETCANINQELVGVIQDFENSLKNYPILDEDAFSAREWEEINRYLEDEIDFQLRYHVRDDFDEELARPDLRQAMVQFMLDIANDGPHYHGELYYNDKSWHSMLQHFGLMEPDDGEFLCEQCGHIKPEAERSNGAYNTPLCHACYNHRQRMAGQLSLPFGE